ncbi:leucine--tRNA ligase [Photorhabdus viridis]|uniref:leucine--tRNA ligase n=1 Tax=Photorhabdus viridis TaxID=3163327 RepID=UPI0033078B1B
MFNYKEIEKKWNEKWEEENVYKTTTNHDAKKFYCLDMFPYPSGAGLHVGHPLGYIATDILCRFKRLNGYNVLHAMGFDSFGLPAEQFAIETGQHPEITTARNIKNFNSQLRSMGLSLDKSRTFKTSDKEYYKWTQWIFLKLFNSWYDINSDKARNISDLIKIFEKNGSNNVITTRVQNTKNFTSQEWGEFSEKEKSDILMSYRLAYLSYSTVNWCPNLGTVLANDEVINGLSERGGHPVEKKKMKQWMLRITAYADRLLHNLNSLEWPESLKETQKNWIGRSQGVIIKFNIENSTKTIDIYTSEPEKLFGVTFICISPEHFNMNIITEGKYKKIVSEHILTSLSRSELERASNIKDTSGVFTGSYVMNPVNNKKIPIWVGDYVLSHYGTGAIMAIPAHNSQDAIFSEIFNIEKIQVIKNGEIINSNFLNGLDIFTGRERITSYLSESIINNIVNYNMRDAIFGRQRYWGEPIPIYYDNDIPKDIDESDLPLELPIIDKYFPTADGAPPLGRAINWLYKDKYQYELTTMPGWAGSSWYFIRYMSPDNSKRLVNVEEANYWREVDIYMGGSEHATGHLLYSRFWSLFLYDLGIINFEEPFLKIVNQGMIQGRSSFIYRVKGENTFVSSDIKENYDTQRINVDIKYISDNDILDIENFRTWRKDYKESKFIYNKDSFKCDWQIEKMSKSKHNVVNPDHIIDKYGADVFRIYEMFLGPIHQSKLWNLGGIEGIQKFINKVWRLFYDSNGKLLINDNTPNENEKIIIHKMLSKVSEDIERLSFNTAITSLMICVNELNKIECHNSLILKDFLIALSPFAVYLSQELWSNALFLEGYLINQSYPKINKKYLKNEKTRYPITINGKVRAIMEFEVSESKEFITNEALKNPIIRKWIGEGNVKNVIFIPGKIINIVI